jgi:hypothetical protein
LTRDYHPALVRHQEIDARDRWRAPNRADGWVHFFEHKWVHFHEHRDPRGADGGSRERQQLLRSELTGRRNPHHIVRNACFVYFNRRWGNPEIMGDRFFETNMSCKAR